MASVQNVLGLISKKKVNHISNYNSHKVFFGLKLTLESTIYLCRTISFHQNHVVCEIATKHTLMEDGRKYKRHANRVNTIQV